MMIVVMLVIFGVVFFLFRRSPPGDRHHWGPPWHMMDRGTAPAAHSAIQILNERFARGEIEQDEYEKRKAILLGNGQQ